MFTSRPVCVAFASALSFVAGALAAPLPDGGSAKVALSLLQSICLGGDTSAPAVLARADAAGWRKTKPADAEGGWDPSRDRSLQVGPRSFMVDAFSIDEKRAHGDTCSIGTWSETTGWRDAAQQWLGVPPALSAGPAATFDVMRTETGWRVLSGQDVSNAATLEGQLYAFMVSDGVRRGDDHVAALMMVSHHRAATKAN